MQHVIKNQIETVVVGIDAEKAFDSVGWDFLYRVLERFHFHKTFIKVIQALYNEPTARIRSNGSLSKFITLERGCRQGCSASPLFVICLEPLSNWIKQNENITGIEDWVEVMHNIYVMGKITFSVRLEFTDLKEFGKAG